ncbi:MAG TPA: T9SS type A sorting domain-containing protein [Flavipsychrobacter sp.]|nr:T9SS type A sorting domain-containing protein [Flavipsychrobacter sp.]
MKKLLLFAVLALASQLATAQCNATITPLGPTALCQGESVTLQASPGNLYRWFLNGNYIALLTTNIFSVNTPGSYKVVVDSMGCIDTSAALVVTVNAVPPQAIISVNSSIVCQGSSTALVASSGNAYQWYLNGASISGANNDTFLATVAGSYIVVIDSMGCEDTSSVQVMTASATPAQPGPITFSSDTVCASTAVTLSVDPVAGATSYEWGVMSNIPVMQTTAVPSVTDTVYHSWSMSTPATAVFVKAINSCGSSPMSTDSLAIYSPVNTTGMNNDPDITYLGLPAYICPTGSANELNAFSHWAMAGYSGTGTYQWYRNNVPISGATGYSYNVTRGGSYKVVITTGGVCQATIQKPAIHQVAPLPASVDIFTPQPLCTGGVIILKVNFDNDGYNGGNYNWWWLRNDTIVSGSAFLAATSPGEYKIDFWGYGYNNQLVQCPASQVLANITLSGTQATPVSIVQNGNDFTATSGFVAYQWYKNNVPISGATSNVYAKTIWGDYFVVATGGNGCHSKSNVILGMENVKAGEYHIVLFPNPNSGRFTLSAGLKENRSAELVITDLTGRLIQARQIKTLNGVIEEKIDLESYIMPGLYLLKLTTENYTKVISFVKQ